MKLHTVFITYNRLELTKRALASYLETVTLPYSYVIVDNGSSDGTVGWLRDSEHPHLCLYQNRYPGYACNQGFGLRPDDATHLQRADNDFIFLEGWCEQVSSSFQHLAFLGQLGLRTNEEEQSSINVGGNCVIPVDLWNKKLRWDERPWPQIREEIGPGWTEDSLMSIKVRKLGWHWARVRQPCIQPISVEDPEDEYYQRTWADRGIAL